MQGHFALIWLSWELRWGLIHSSRSVQDCCSIHSTLRSFWLIPWGFGIGFSHRTSPGLSGEIFQPCRFEPVFPDRSVLKTEDAILFEVRQPILQSSFRERRDSGHRLNRDLFSQNRREPPQFFFFCAFRHSFHMLPAYSQESVIWVYTLPSTIDKIDPYRQVRLFIQSLSCNITTSEPSDRYYPPL